MTGNIRGLTGLEKLVLASLSGNVAPEMLAIPH
jgi:hypothetical protein